MIESLVKAIVFSGGMFWVGLRLNTTLGPQILAGLVAGVVIGIFRGFSVFLVFGFTLAPLLYWRLRANANWKALYFVALVFAFLVEGAIAIAESGQ